MCSGAPKVTVHISGKGMISPTYRRRFAANSAQAGYAFDEVSPAIGHAGRWR